MRFCDGWVKTVDVERGKQILLPVGYAGEPISYIRCAFPLVQLCHFSDLRVDVVENFTDFQVGFCGIYEAACGVVGEVVSLVF